MSAHRSWPTQLMGMPRRQTRVRIRASRRPKSLAGQPLIRPSDGVLGGLGVPVAHREYGADRGRGGRRGMPGDPVGTVDGRDTAAQGGPGQVGFEIAEPCGGQRRGGQCYVVEGGAPVGEQSPVPAVGRRATDR